MKPMTSPARPHPTQPAPRKLTLAKETLRRLSPAQLRLAAGGGAGKPSYDPWVC